MSIGSASIEAPGDAGVATRAAGEVADRVRHLVLAAWAAAVRRAPGLAPLATAPVVALVAVRSWYSPGRFVAAGDISPFVREGLAHDVKNVWSYGLTGAGSPSAEIARLPEYLFHRLGVVLGLAPEVAQAIFFWSWLTLASLGVIVLVRQFVPSRAAQVAVGVLAIANPLMAVNLPNPLVPVALGTLGLLAASLVRAARGHGSARRTLLSSLPVAYLCINPPTLAVVVAVLALGVVALLANRPSRRPLLRHLGSSAPLVLLVHLWWVVPAVVLYGAGGGAEMAAVTDPQSWSWTHVNNSIANVTSLTAQWGWGLHEYFPFSQDLDEMPWSPMRWALPLLVVAAPLVARHPGIRRVAGVTLGVAGLCIVVGKGLHPPAAWFNEGLYRAPGMWLLREPMSKIGPVLLLAYLLAVGIAVDGIAHRAGSLRRAGVAGRSMWGVVAAVVIAAVAFGSPVLAGAVAPENRAPLPSARVAVPAGWYELADAVNADPLPGKALVLPRIGFYQATTTWDYHGVATLPRDLLRRPTFLQLPGSYFTDAEPVADLIRVVETAADDAALDRALDALGVSHVVIRTDLSDRQAVSPVADVQPLVDRLVDSGAFARTRDYGVAVVLTRPDASVAPTVHARTATADTSAGVGGIGRAVSALDSDVVLVPSETRSDVSAAVVDRSAGSASSEVFVHRAGVHEVEAQVPASLSVAMVEGPSGAALDPGLQLLVDQRPVASASPVALALPDPEARVVGLRVDDRPVLVEPGGRIDLPIGARVSAIQAAGPPTTVQGWSEVGDCNRKDDSAPELQASQAGEDLVLSAEDHSACVWSELPTSGEVRLELEMRADIGSARLCLWVPAEERCAWTEVAHAEETEDAVWHRVDQLVTVAEGSQLFLYADSHGDPARARFRRAQITPLVAGDPATFSLPTMRADVHLTEGRHVVGLGQVPGETARVGAHSGVDNCQQRGEGSLLSVLDVGRSIRLLASGEAACVVLPVSSMQVGVAYEVSFSYRTRSPSPARWCLWLDGADRCANLEQVLPTTSDWREVRATVDLPGGATSPRMYLYADGDPSMPVTVNDYRDAAVRPAAPSVITVEPAERATSDLELVSSELSGPWTMRIRSDGGRFVLALPDSQHELWRLRGLPSGATATATVVDGFRQGWVIEGAEGQFELEAEFAPTTVAAAGRTVSALTLAGLVVPWSGIRRRMAPLRWPRRRRGRHTPRPEARWRRRHGRGAGRGDVVHHRE